MLTWLLPVRRLRGSRRGLAGRATAAYPSRFCLVLLLAAGLAAGCSPGSHQPAADGAVPQIDRVDDLVLPVETYRLTAAQKRLVSTARSALIQECLRPFGLVRTAPAASDGSLSVMARRYGVTDPAIAAQWGYHLTPEQGSAQRTAPGPALSPAELLVLTGDSAGAGPALSRSYHGIPVPPGGCAAEAATRLGLGGDDPFGGSLVSTIDAQAYAESKADARVTAVFSAWSSCMRASGFSYATPLAPAAGLDLTSPERTKEELRTATADVACKAEHNVIGVWFTVDSARESVLIRQHAPALAAVKQRIDDVLRQAAIAAPPG